MNTSHLCGLLMKSKSCVNGALALMKFLPLPTGEDENETLFQAIPYLRSHYAEFRQWTIRRVRTFEATPVPIPPTEEHVDEQFPIVQDFEWDIPAVPSEWNDPEWLASGPLALSLLVTQMAAQPRDLDFPWQWESAFP
jgi:hypothetical protein